MILCKFIETQEYNKENFIFKTHDIFMFSPG